jgi:hypothetical protein
MFSAGFGLIAAARAERWLAPMAQGAGAILMFHHVRPWRRGRSRRTACSKSRPPSSTMRCGSCARWGST